MKSIRKNTFQLSWIHFKSYLVRFILFCFGKTEPKTFRLSLKKKNNYRSIFKFYSLDIWARPWKWDSAIYSCYRRGTLFNSLIKILSNPPPSPKQKSNSQFIRCCRCRNHIWFAFLSFLLFHCVFILKCNSLILFHQNKVCVFIRFPKKNPLLRRTIDRRTFSISLNISLHSYSD